MNFKIAEFKAANTKDAQAVLVIVPGSNDDGKWMVNHRTFRDWANTHKVAIVGCHFEDIDPSNIEGYADASGGSGQALLDFLAEKKLDKLPIFLWGFSAGGQFNHEFACWRPELVKAYVVNKGGFYYTALAPPRTREIPALYFVGNHDDLFRQYILHGIVKMNQRDYKCKWKLVVEDVGHDPGDSVQQGLNFFSQHL